MIPNGWRVDKVHKCGAKRLVNAQGHVQTQLPDGEGMPDFFQPYIPAPDSVASCRACGWSGPAREAFDDHGNLRCPSCG